MTSLADDAGDIAGPVTAVVVTYFTGPLLARSLAALRLEPAIGEIILVDNGNWQGSVDDAISASGASGLGAKEIRVLTGHGNVGFATACNLGARAARGDYLLFINPDAIIEQGGTARLIADGLAQAGPGDGLWMIAPRLVNPDGSEQQGSRRMTLTPWRAFVEATRLYRLAPQHPYFRRFNLHDDPCPEKTTPVPCISGAAFLLPKRHYFAIDGMDEQYFLHAEDVDFCLRFANAGGAILFKPDVAVTHYKSSSRVNPLNVEWRKTASLLRYFNVHFRGDYPAPFLWLVWLAMWSLFVTKAAYRIATGGLSALGFRARKGAGASRRARSLANLRANR